MNGGYYLPIYLIMDRTYKEVVTTVRDTMRGPMEGGDEEDEVILLSLLLSPFDCLEDTFPAILKLPPITDEGILG